MPHSGNDWEIPLVRCGIALAGANHALQITNAVAEDGLLTGLEASMLNLRGTELVVLSACAFRSVDGGFLEVDGSSPNGVPDLPSGGFLYQENGPRTGGGGASAGRLCYLKTGKREWPAFIFVTLALIVDTRGPIPFRGSDPERIDMSELKHNCAGMARRDFLQLGIGAVFGLGMTDVLRLRAEAAQAAGKLSPSQVNCILIWMDGGPTHYETFDPKPGAPKEIRGELNPIKTSVPGIQFCETVPKLAAVADKLTIIRSVCHRDPNHGGGNHYMMTGAPTPVPVNCGAFVTFHPSFGSVVSYKRGIQNGLPSYMTLPSMSRSGGPNFLGAQHAPFVISGNPSDKSFKVRDVVLPSSISEGRAATRQQLRQSLDRMLRVTEAAAEDPTVSFDSYYHQGIDLVTSPKAQAAFDLSKEPDKVRDLYGRTDLGQRLLLCRRLVEVGVSFVTCYYGGWDHHTNIFTSLKEKHLPKFDQGLAALLTDLDERGLLDSTLVIALGEFGRTPKVNKDAGRDHWPHAMSILMAGAGTPRGHVIGATDSRGYYASENIHSPEDFAATLYTKMGIDPHQVLHTKTGRPVQLVNGGKPIKDLFVSPNLPRI